MNTYELVKYYADLLIIQYIGKARARATIMAEAAPIIMCQQSVQKVEFETAPTSGGFVLSYDGESSATINYNDAAADIQTKLRALTGLSAVTVTGTVQSFTVNFVDVIAPAELLELVTNTTNAGDPTITETDLILPLAVQAGFNLVPGTDIAQGNQLDILGKYVGVERSGLGFDRNITLDDDEFLILIRLAIAQNNLGSSLDTIQTFLDTYFPGQIFLFDYQNMRMSYVISSTVGSQDLVQLFVAQGLLPKPMAVQISAIYATIIDQFFGFCSYEIPADPDTPMINPFNTYEDYQTDWPWVTYQDSVG